ncbi:exodeoxyribonuclease VII small subunit [Peptoniphilus stercorisuis]|uniref:Exodeoxyribonuclease 7 small subunit n=1 Tax=Peptoniphilus stercorisuis TaxID=1436965 RepID=A0ABS4KB38_9FIRM|nr:exodeoxyribonuclease VII small subunit [Peptoniphilus stercorisuis]MBP2024995.1 exodeoxyribonuclease VII small subunit [Peptoniphilus stercorisuis]
MSESYESAFEKLENIISDLEDENISLEESIEKYEEGIKLYKYCNDILKEYEGKVKVLVEQDEELVQKDFLEGELDG